MGGAGRGEAKGRPQPPAVGGATGDSFTPGCMYELKILINTNFLPYYTNCMLCMNGSSEEGMPRKSKERKNKMSEKKDGVINRQSRKVLFTVNNPEEKGLFQDVILQKISSLKGLRYACISDEIGKEGTYHTHAFACYENPKAFSTFKNLIPEAHIDICKGSCVQNRDYVFKTGKWVLFFKLKEKPIRRLF